MSYSEILATETFVSDLLKNQNGTSSNPGNGVGQTTADNGEIFNNYEKNKAVGNYSHSEGTDTIAYGDYSHAEGQGLNGKEALGENSEFGDLLELISNLGIIINLVGKDENGIESSLEVTLTTNKYIFDLETLVEELLSYECLVEIENSILAPISNAKIIEISNDTFGNQTGRVKINLYNDKAKGIVEGQKITNIYSGAAIGEASHSEGYKSNALGKYSHTEGEYAIALGVGAHAEGRQTKAEESYSHAEGYGTHATGKDSHAEGYGTYATGKDSHTEGYNTQANKDRSHAEGNSTQANGKQSHAEGWNAKANGDNSHAEGLNTVANEENSHAEGYNTQANGYASHTEGWNTIASSEYQNVIGKFNIEDYENKYVAVIGNGQPTGRDYDYTTKISTASYSGSLDANKRIATFQPWEYGQEIGKGQTPYTMHFGMTVTELTAPLYLEYNYSIDGGAKKTLLTFSNDQVGVGQGFDNSNKIINVTVPYTINIFMDIVDCYGSIYINDQLLYQGSLRNSGNDKKWREIRVFSLAASENIKFTAADINASVYSNIVSINDVITHYIIDDKALRAPDLLNSILPLEQKAIKGYFYKQLENSWAENNVVIENNDDQTYSVQAPNYSNAYTLDWDGNAWFAGDVVVNDKSFSEMNIQLQDFIENGEALFTEIYNTKANKEDTYTKTEVDNKIASVEGADFETKLREYTVTWDKVTSGSFDYGLPLDFGCVENIMDDKADVTKIYSLPEFEQYQFIFPTKYNTETRFKELNTLSFTFGNEVYQNDYMSGISFDSGETPTAVDYTDSGILNWVGTDCAMDSYVNDEGITVPISKFQPSANTHYDIVFYFNGNQFIGLVNGYVPTTQLPTEQTEGNVVSE